MNVAAALARIDQAGPRTAAGKADLLALIRAGVGGPEVLRRLETATAPPLARAAEDIELLLAMAQQAWIADQRAPTAVRARDAAQQLIALVPDLPDGYRLLGFAHLSRGAYQEAYLAFSAMKTVAGAANFDNFRALARHMMTGLNPVTFDLGGARYTFDLTTHNAAATESSAFHSVGLLTEWEELQYLGATVGRPQRIVEVGVLLGNHTAYFLKTFAPHQLVLIDADPANLPFMRSTVGYNIADGGAPDVEMHTAFVGGRNQSAVSFAGAQVPQRTLAELAPGQIDFLKIDVDGGELALLDGAASVIEASRPAVMIETTPTTHDPVVAWFAARGYDVRRIFDHGSYRNVIVVPASAKQ
jgi:FkbM family methyltransferase